MRVFFSPKAVKYLSELVQILYLNNYFGFKSDAKEYVDDLYSDIKTSIDKKSKKKAPEYFSKYGKDLYYVSYRKNHNTQWYVFFNKVNNDYFIEYIGNNHTCSQHL